MSDEPKTAAGLDAYEALAREAGGRADAATKGPWLRQASFSLDPCVESEATDKDSVPLLMVDIHEDVNRANADFIAHARSDVPAMRDAILTLTEEVRRRRVPRAYLGAGHPWMDFVHHRARALRWCRDALGATAETLAHVFSINPGQVQAVLAWADTAEEFATERAGE